MTVPASTRGGLPGGASVVTKRIKVGVAGAGVFGGHHASKYARNERAELTGVYDLDPRRATALAEKLGSQSFPEFETLLDACDAIVVAAPAVAHYELASRALAAGRHVFIEKPVTLCVDEADELIALAEKNELILQVGHQERYVFEAAGLLGRNLPPLRISSIRSTNSSGRCEDVSVVLDLMVHDIDLIRQLTKAEIANLEAGGNEHNAYAEFELTNGAVVSLKASRRSPAPERRMTLSYDDGVIEFDFLKREVSNSTRSALETDFSNASPPLAFTDPLAFGANEFIINILENRTPAVCGHDGREAVRWARRIEASAGIADRGLKEETKRVERRRA